MQTAMASVANEIGFNLRVLERLSPNLYFTISYVLYSNLYLFMLINTKWTDIVCFTKYNS